MRGIFSKKLCSTLTWKADLHNFSLFVLMKKDRKSTFIVRISVYKIIIYYLVVLKSFVADILSCHDVILRLSELQNILYHLLKVPNSVISNFFIFFRVLLICCWKGSNLLTLLPIIWWKALLLETLSNKISSQQLKKSLRRRMMTNTISIFNKTESVHKILL